MDYQEILYAVEDHVLTITLNRPEKLNAWTMVMEGEYRHAKIGRAHV
jgi:enoyl-CoA hydratase/carnithine racemase